MRPDCPSTKRQCRGDAAARIVEHDLAVCLEHAREAKWAGFLIEPLPEVGGA